jgi:hypothetical protein
MNRHQLTCRAAILIAHGATVAQALVTGLPLEDTDDDHAC